MQYAVIIVIKNSVVAFLMLAINLLSLKTDFTVIKLSIFEAS
jgi:hypothetical protein